MQRQSWPRAWLMTDERLGGALGGAIDRAAAAGAGIIVRHHASPLEMRWGIAQQVLSRGAVLGISRDVELARQLAAGLVHNPQADASGMPFSISVHDEEQAGQAKKRRPALVFVSPLFPTGSHPNAPALGLEAAERLAALTGCPAVALGGVTQAEGRLLLERGWTGWAGIDAWR